ncbi:protein CsuC [Izhakiella australiensis]|uniref:Protein CsuC n=1 Tax=Izhakiella australiensis TaxID=1926881 RepID=A0A1S8YSZ2_9GAMM|nr:molecular chaperone [Izhakiella australiensis]OON41968.1 protein CsuC [Izhakiella australiensis]
MSHSLIRPLFLTLLLCSLVSTARAGNSVMIWPIDPILDSDDKAAELWLENRGDATTLMQVRIFGWRQLNGNEQYQNQQDVVASPPMVRIEPGKRQLIRLIKQRATPAGKESAYRILLDEIPAPPAPGSKQAGLAFQMRYSVPLFVYGQGLVARNAKPQLSWHIAKRDGRQLLLIDNRGSGHARLSNVTLAGRQLSSSLLGYVLAGSQNAFPLNFPASVRDTLSAQLSTTRSWQSKGSPQAE